MFDTSEVLTLIFLKYVFILIQESNAFYLKKYETLIEVFYTLQKRLKDEIERKFKTCTFNKECELVICEISLYKHNQEELMKNICFYLKPINAEPKCAEWENVKNSVGYIPFVL